MQNIKKLLPQGLLLAFVLKMLLISPTLPDMGIVFALAAIVGLTASLEKKDEIDDIKVVINKQNEVIQVMSVEVAKMKQTVEGVRLKNEFVNGNGLKKVV